MMQAYSSFLYPVHDYGLPLSHMLREAHGQEVISGLRAEDLARLYWTLERVQVSYAFEVMGKRVERTYEVPVTPVPHERAVKLPVCVFEKDELGSALYFKLSLGSPGREAGGRFALDFELLDESIYGVYQLGTGKPEAFEQMTQVNANFWDHEISLYLGLKKDTQGQIIFCNVQPIWARFMLAGRKGDEMLYT